MLHEPLLKLSGDDVSSDTPLIESVCPVPCRCYGHGPVPCPAQHTFGIIYLQILIFVEPVPCPAQQTFGTKYLQIQISVAPVPCPAQQMFGVIYLQIFTNRSLFPFACKAHQTVIWEVLPSFTTSDQNVVLCSTQATYPLLLGFRRLPYPCHQTAL